MSKVEGSQWIEEVNDPERISYGFFAMIFVWCVPFEIFCIRLDIIKEKLTDSANDRCCDDDPLIAGMEPLR